MALLTHAMAGREQMSAKTAQSMHSHRQMIPVGECVLWPGGRPEQSFLLQDASCDWVPASTALLASVAPAALDGPAEERGERQEAEKAAEQEWRQHSSSAEEERQRLELALEAAEQRGEELAEELAKARAAAGEDRRAPKGGTIGACQRCGEQAAAAAAAAEAEAAAEQRLREAAVLLAEKQRQLGEASAALHALRAPPAPSSPLARRPDPQVPVPPFFPRPRTLPLAPPALTGCWAAQEGAAVQEGKADSTGLGVQERGGGGEERSGECRSCSGYQEMLQDQQRALNAIHADNSALVRVCAALSDQVRALPVGETARLFSESLRWLLLAHSDATGTRKHALTHSPTLLCSSQARTHT